MAEFSFLGELFHDTGLLFVFEDFLSDPVTPGAGDYFTVSPPTPS